MRRILSFVLIGIILFAAGKWITGNLIPAWKVNQLKNAALPGWVNIQLIDVDGNSRRGEQLDAIKDIVVHYVGNPGTTAQQNRDFYSNADSEVSSHFVIGLEGEVILCVPLNEKSSASNWRNSDTISIEVCHPDRTGKFTEASYNSLIRLTAWLCDLCELNEKHIIRHYDITGKECPLYFVENEEEWIQFKAEVLKYRESGSY